MSSVSLPVTRPSGRCLVVGQAAFRSGAVARATREGFACGEADDPYQAMVQLCRRPLFFSAVVFSVNSLYREELEIIACLKRRFSHIEVWLSDTDGRQAVVAEAAGLGADGFLAEDGLHRIGPGTPPPEPKAPPPAPQSPADLTVPMTTVVPAPGPPTQHSTEPILTAEELRALLQE